MPTNPPIGTDYDHIDAMNLGGLTGVVRHMLKDAQAREDVSELKSAFEQETALVNGKFGNIIETDYANLERTETLSDIALSWTMNKAFICSDGNTGAITDTSGWAYALCPVEGNKKYRLHTSAKADIYAITFLDENENLFFADKNVPSTAIVDADFIAPFDGYLVIHGGTYSYVNMYAKEVTTSYEPMYPYSANLFDKRNVLDKKLISYNTGTFSTYNDSIITGFVPIEEGFTYTITNGKDSETNQLYINVIVFYNDNDEPVCAYPSYTGITGYTGIVDVTGDSTVLTFKAKPGNGITKCCWFISKSTDSNYYGSHNGLTGITDQIQMNYGSMLLAYDAFSYKETVLLNRVTENTVDIDNLDNRVSAVESSNQMVKLNKTGAILKITSDFTGDKNIVINCNIAGSDNGAFRINSYYTVDKTTGTETQFKTASDDICPLFICGTYVGANHGFFNSYRLTVTGGHGLTEANIGEIWKDSNNNDLLIIRIPSDTNIDVCCPNENDPQNAFMSIVTIGSSITRNGVTKSVTNPYRRQLTPSVKTPSVKVMLNGIKQITDSGDYNADFIDVVESYDIIYPLSMIEYLEEHVGYNTNATYYSSNIDSFCTARNIYRFTERGAMTVYSSVDFKHDALWSFYGIVQSETIGDYLAVPNSIYDSMTQQNSSDIIISKSSAYRDADNPPNRFYQFSDSSMTTGMLLGYNTEYGDCTPTKQKESSNVGFYYGSSHKVYPKVSAKEEIKQSGDSFNGVAYRIPLAVYDPDIKAVGWYRINDDIYLTIESFTNTDKLLALPDYMNGMSVEVVESFGNITIKSPFVSGGIMVKIADGYGSAIVKLKK